MMLVIDGDGPSGPWPSEKIVGILSRLGVGSVVTPNLREGRAVLAAGSVTSCTIRGWNGSARMAASLRRMRADHPGLAIQVIGPKADVNGVVAAFDNGTDHYVADDCSVDEMEARLKRLVAGHAPSKTDMSASDLQVWRDSQTAFRAGTPIRLSKKEMKILRYLVKCQNRPVSRAELLREVFEMDHDPGTNLVEVHIHRLRRKVDAGQCQKLLKTVRGAGYMFG